MKAFFDNISWPSVIAAVLITVALLMFLGRR